MNEFFTKYPDADPSRFVFKNEKVWFKLNPDNENRLLDIESDTYQRTPSWTKYLTSYNERGFGIWFADGTVQPYKKNTNTKDINKLKVYVTNDKYFALVYQLPITNTSSTDYKHVIHRLQKESISHCHYSCVRVNLRLRNKFATHGI